MRLLQRMGLGSVVALACVVLISRTPRVRYIRNEPAPDTAVVSFSTTVPTNEIRGVVLEQGTGKPPSGAQVLISKANLGVLTDGRGYFVLRGALPDSFVLQVLFLGYNSWSTSITRRPAEGLVMVVPLEQPELDQCEYIGGLPGGVAVAVRDAASGIAPRGVVKLEVHDGKYSDNVRGSINPADLVDDPGARERDPLYLQAAKGRVGVYHVSVTSPGFHAWTRSGVDVKRLTCNRIDQVTLNVWLIPR